MPRVLCALSLVCLVVAAPARAASFPVPLGPPSPPDGLWRVLAVGQYVYGIVPDSDAIVSYTARGGRLAHTAVVGERAGAA